MYDSIILYPTSLTWQDTKVGQKGNAYRALLCIEINCLFRMNKQAALLFNIAGSTSGMALSIFTGTTYKPTLNYSLSFNTDTFQPPLRQSLILNNSTITLFLCWLLLLDSVRRRRRHVIRRYEALKVCVLTIIEWFFVTSGVLPSAVRSKTTLKARNAAWSTLISWYWLSAGRATNSFTPASSHCGLHFAALFIDQAIACYDLSQRTRVNLIAAMTRAETCSVCGNSNSSSCIGAGRREWPCSTFGSPSHSLSRYFYGELTNSWWTDGWTNKDTIDANVRNTAQNCFFSATDWSS